MNQIILWIELGMFVSPTSEHVYVTAWSLIFNILLVDTNTRAIPRTYSKASTLARRRMETAFGSTTSTSCDRKEDISIRIRVENQCKTEIAIFEFKSSTATMEICRRQQKKSMRLSAAILLDLEARGLDISKSFPVIAEGKALSMNFYTLRRFDDVLGAGRPTRKGIFLPSQVEDLKAFLESNTMMTLLAFKEHLRRYAIDITDVLVAFTPTSFGYDNNEDEDEDEDDQIDDLPSPLGTETQPGTPHFGLTQQ
ncbi:hypothetical protein BGW38_007887, partial [Lunasporangiospora selenospora]